MAVYNNVNFNGSRFPLVGRATLTMPMTIVELTKVISELLASKRDLQRTIVEAHRLVLQLLVDTGCLPSPKKGYVGSAMHGPNPILWEYVRGFEIDSKHMPTLKYFEEFELSLHKLGLTIDFQKIKKNFMPIDAVDFTDTEELKRVLHVRGYSNTRHYIFKHPKAFFAGQFNEAMQRFVRDIASPEATIVVMEEPELLAQYERFALIENGYKDVLPELILPSALDNLRRNENVIVDMHAGQCLRFGGALRVFRKQIS